MNEQESKKLEAKIINTLSLQIRKNDHVILGFSGGPDSVFLLKMLIQLQKKTKFRIILAHINHMLRGKESDLDEKFAAESAKNHKCGFEKMKKDVGAAGKKTKKGVEEIGREIRYDFFKKLAKKYKAAYVLTAHHADDNLETIIMNFARGAHLKGLSGMEEIENFIGKTKLFRPILSVSKNQITNYLKFHKIPYQVDKTNKDTIYKRNFIRYKIVPYLKQLNPNLTDSVAKNTDNLRETYQYLSKSAQNWIKKNSLNKTFTEFHLKKFEKEAAALKKQILIELHKILAKTTKDIKKIHIDEVLKVLENRFGNKKKKLGKLVIYLKNGIIKILLNK